MHNIPFVVNPVTALLLWDIWQSLYGNCVMPALEHSIHPETRKQTWNYFMSLLMSQQKNSLGNICTTFNHHQNLRYNIASSGFYAQYTFCCKSSDAFASMRYLTISVWPLPDANIKALHPSWNEKANMELVYITTYVSTKAHSLYHIYYN